MDGGQSVAAAIAAKLRAMGITGNVDLDDVKLFDLGPEQHAEDDAEADGFPVGRRVVLHGLQAAGMNGRHGVVVRRMPKKPDRVAVRLDGDTALRSVKTQNLDIVPPDIVSLEASNRDDPGALAHMMLTIMRNNEPPAADEPGGPHAEPIRRYGRQLQSPERAESSEPPPDARECLKLRIHLLRSATATGGDTLQRKVEDLLSTAEAMLDVPGAGDSTLPTAGAQLYIDEAQSLMEDQCGYQQVAAWGADA